MASIDFIRLTEKFPEDNLEWRIAQAGLKNGKPWAKVLAYIDNRAIMNRLDDVCGPENWKNEFQKAPEGGVLCGLSIRAKDEWVTKWDGAENTKVESVKGGLSDAMKRAGYQWGIGRYLYNITESWAIFDNEKGQYIVKIVDSNKEDHWFKWNPPRLGPEFLPSADKKKLGNELDSRP
jgi:hypothetical protein